jgi:hypothetical protein
MAVTAKEYAHLPAAMNGGASAGNASICWLANTFKVELVTSSHTISQAHTIKGDLTNEASGTGYTAGGATLAGKSNSTSGLSAWTTGTDVSWTSASFSAASAHMYDDTTATPVKPLIMYVDFGGTQTVTAATLTIQWNASGIWALTVA